jgi:hypothetical protein
MFIISMTIKIMEAEEVACQDLVAKIEKKMASLTQCSALRSKSIQKTRLTSQLDPESNEKPKDIYK